MSHIEIKHLRLIQTLAATQNLTQAARKLAISQPALSRQLLDIEDRLGTLLFLRSGKRMVLTPEGARMLSSADSILHELEMAELDISKLVNGETGAFRIGVSCIFCFQWLPRIVADFQALYPKVDLSISSCCHYFEELKADTFDMVITAAPVQTDGVACVELLMDEVVCIMAPDHPLRARRCLKSADIAGAKLILHRNVETSHFLQALWPGATISPEAVMRIDQPHAIIELVKEGLGISFSPRWAVGSYLHAGQLCAVPIAERGIQAIWKVVYLACDALPPFQQTFIDLMLKGDLPCSIS